jgi:hypothetical protein
MAREALARGDRAGAGGYLAQALEIDRGDENQAGLAEDLEMEGALRLESGDRAGAASSLERAFYLRAALKDSGGMKRILDGLSAFHRDYGVPKNLAPFRAVARDPSLFDPLGERCP